VTKKGTNYSKIISKKSEANLAVNDHCGYQFVFRDRAFHQKWFPRSKNLLLFNLKKCKKIKKN
jgi:hypothetical protein